MPAEAIFKVVAAYYLGLLPFIRLPYDVLSIPYVTRDYLFMKIRESREVSKGFIAYIAFILFCNLTVNPMIEHLNKRGVFTDYWVINDDEDIRRVITTTKVSGVMSDRPSRVKEILTERKL